MHGNEVKDGRNRIGRAASVLAGQGAGGRACRTRPFGGGLFQWLGWSWSCERRLVRVRQPGVVAQRHEAEHPCLRAVHAVTRDQELP